MKEYKDAGDLWRVQMRGNGLFDRQLEEEEMQEEKEGEKEKEEEEKE